MLSLKLEPAYVHVFFKIKRGMGEGKDDCWFGEKRTARLSWRLRNSDTFRCSRLSLIFSG